MSNSHIYFIRSPDYDTGHCSNRCAGCYSHSAASRVKKWLKSSQNGHFRTMLATFWQCAPCYALSHPILLIDVVPRNTSVYFGP